MKMDIRYGGILFGILLVLTTTGMLGPASAVTGPWHVGAENTSLPAGTVDVITYVNVPNLPSTATGSTFFWLGADSAGSGNVYLTQPLIALWYPGGGINQWRVVFQTNLGGNPVENYPTTMVCNPGGSALLYDAILSDGRNFQDAENRSNCNFTGVSHYFTGVNYGNHLIAGYATLESYDRASSHFHPMNGNIQFTSYRSSTDYVTWITRTLTAYTFNSPPSCIRSTGGSGTATITINC